MIFSLFAFRFTFEALDPVFFPPGAAGNAFRGAFGHILRRIACQPDCPSPRVCEVRDQCAYARVFEPACLDGPSGLADAPRPFVVRAGALDGQSYQSGEAFWIDVHIFDLHEPIVAYFVLAFHQLAASGIGAERGRIRLIHVCALDAARCPGARIYDADADGNRSLTVAALTTLGDLLSLPLDPLEDAGPQSLTLRFITPTELKSDGKILREAPFGIVFARARDRVATLSALYGSGPIEIDFRGMAERAALVGVASSTLRWESHKRRSSRTQQVHPLSGFIGEVRYQGNMAEFIPFLRAASWAGIGRQTVWGKGAVEIV
jgi:hypothetical protein